MSLFQNAPFQGLHPSERKPSTTQPPRIRKGSPAWQRKDSAQYSNQLASTQKEETASGSQPVPLASDEKIFNVPVYQPKNVRLIKKQQQPFEIYSDQHQDQDISPFNSVPNANRNFVHEEQFTPSHQFSSSYPLQQQVAPYGNPINPFELSPYLVQPQGNNSRIGRASTIQDNIFPVTAAEELPVSVSDNKSSTTKRGERPQVKMQTTARKPSYNAKPVAKPVRYNNSEVIKPQSDQDLIKKLISQQPPSAKNSSGKPSQISQQDAVDIRKSNTPIQFQRQPQHPSMSQQVNNSVYRISTQQPVIPHKTQIIQPKPVDVQQRTIVDVQQRTTAKPRHLDETFNSFNSVAQEIVKQQVQEEIHSLRSVYEEQLKIMQENQVVLVRELQQTRIDKEVQQQEFNQRITDLSSKMMQQIEFQRQQQQQLGKSQSSLHSMRFAGYDKAKVLQPPDYSTEFQRIQGVHQKPRIFQTGNAAPVSNGSVVSLSKVSQHRSELYLKPVDEVPSPREQRTAIFGEQQLIQAHGEELKEVMNDRDTMRLTVNMQRVSAQREIEESDFMRYLATTYPIESFETKQTKSQQFVSPDERDLLAEEYTFCSLCNHFLTFTNSEKHTEVCAVRDQGRQVKIRDLDLVKLFCGWNMWGQQRQNTIFQKTPEVQIMEINEELRKIEYLTHLEMTKQKDFSLNQRQVMTLGYHSQSILMLIIECNKQHERVYRLSEDYKRVFQMLDSKEVTNHTQLMFIMQKGCIFTDRKAEMMRRVSV